MGARPRFKLIEKLDQLLIRFVRGQEVPTETQLLEAFDRLSLTDQKSAVGVANYLLSLEALQENGVITSDVSEITGSP